MCSANKEERMTVFETYISIEFEYVTSRFSAISLHCMFGHPCF